MDLTWEHLDVNEVFKDGLYLFDIDIWHVIELNLRGVLIDKNVDAILSVLVDFLNNRFFQNIIGCLFGTNNGLDLAPQEFVVIQLVFLVLTSHEVKRLLSALHLHLCHMESIFSVIGNFLNSASFIAKFLISGLLDDVKLFRAICKGVGDLTRRLSRQPVNELTLGLANDLLGNLMLFDVVARVIVELLENIIVNKDCSIDFVLRFLSLFAIDDVVDSFDNVGDCLAFEVGVTLAGHLTFFLHLDLLLEDLFSVVGSYLLVLEISLVVKLVLHSLGLVDHIVCVAVQLLEVAAEGLVLISQVKCLVGIELMLALLLLNLSLLLEQALLMLLLLDLVVLKLAAMHLILLVLSADIFLLQVHILFLFLLFLLIILALPVFVLTRTLLAFAFVSL